MIKGYGLAHVVLNVSDIRHTKKFYETLFDTSFQMDNKHSFSLLTVGIPCWFSSGDKPSEKFNEKHVGLNHVAFKLQTLNELKKVIQRLDQMNVKNAGLQRFAGKYPYVAFDDPDGIYIEFFISKEL